MCESKVPWQVAAGVESVSKHTALNIKISEGSILVGRYTHTYTMQLCAYLYIRCWDGRHWPYSERCP